MTDKVNSEFRINEVIELIKKRKNVTSKQISESTGISKVNVCQFLSSYSNGNMNAVKNYTLDRTEIILKACGEELIILDSEGKRFTPGNDIATFQKLEKRIGKFSLKTTIGEFQIITR